MVIDKFEGKYEFLSNFADSPFEFEGITYPTNEHFFQAMKTKDLSQRMMIAFADTPGQAKRAGRRVALRKDWEQVKVDVMKQGLRLKFDSNPDLKEQLLATGNATLIEGTLWHDNEWGNCTCPQCVNIPGKNLLGKALMELRSSYGKV